MKNYKLKRIVIDGIEYQYFYFVEKYYSNGNGRYRVFILDPDAPAVYETVIKEYITLLEYRIKELLENQIGIAVPF
jgi:hypothetical protein